MFKARGLSLIIAQQTRLWQESAAAFIMLIFNFLRCEIARQKITNKRNEKSWIHLMFIFPSRLLWCRKETEDLMFSGMRERIGRLTSWWCVRGRSCFLFPPVFSVIGWLVGRTVHCWEAGSARWFLGVSCQLFPWFDPTCQGDRGRLVNNMLA